MSFVSTFTYPKMNIDLEMLTQREQLVEDIVCIMESHFPNENVDETIKQLCNAVCINFPLSNN
jgi:hypothetical protein